MCNVKNHYRSKKWYSHGRTGSTADGGPGVQKYINILVKISIYVCDGKDVMVMTLKNAD